MKCELISMTRAWDKDKVGIPHDDHVPLLYFTGASLVQINLRAFVTFLSHIIND